MMKARLARGTYVVAVSGGVDSMVLLDILAGQADLELIVAHFDHGIRHDSASDAVFVQMTAQRYSLPFELGRATLGPGASEEAARTVRYTFLRSIAKKYQAQIVTAHHADDVIETIAINVSRGTGWRGLVSLRDGHIKRPLLGVAKSTIVDYARAHNLEWREDVTNNDHRYLRNRIRKKLRRATPEEKKKLYNLYQQQLSVAQAIDAELAHIMSGFSSPAYPRYFFIMIDDGSAVELLNAMIHHHGAKGASRPQLRLALAAIKTYRAGARHDIAGGLRLVFTSTTFIVEYS